MLDEAHEPHAPHSSHTFGWDDIPWKGVGWGVALVTMIAATLFLAIQHDRDIDRRSSEELESVLLRLDHGRRNGAGLGPLFIG